MTDPLESDSDQPEPPDQPKPDPQAESQPDSAAPPDVPADQGNPPQLENAPSSQPRKRFFPAMGQGNMGPTQEKFWASLGHLLSLTGIFTAAFGYVIGPLISYLLKRGESPFVDEHAKETLNFSILTFIVIAGSGLLGFAACFLWIITAGMALFNLIFCIQGALAAKNGEAYRYPFNFRILK